MAEVVWTVKMASSEMRQKWHNRNERGKWCEVWGMRSGKMTQLKWVGNDTSWMRRKMSQVKRERKKHTTNLACYYHTLIHLNDTPKTYRICWNVPPPALGPPMQQNYYPDNLFHSERLLSFQRTVRCLWSLLFAI